MTLVPRIGHAPITTTGLLVGAATFVIMEVVLSVTLWVDSVSAFGATGLYDIATSLIRPLRTAEPTAEPTASPAVGTPGARSFSNGHSREPIGAR